MGVLYLLYESASGFGLFENVKSEEIGTSLEDVQTTVTDLGRFSKIMKMKAFLPFTSAENALQNINAVSEGELTPYLSDFLEMNISKKSKKDGSEKEIVLGVVDPKIGNAISETLKIKCKSNDVVLELLRGIRLHFERFIKALKPGDLAQAQLGLSHSYSRSKVKFNVHKVDNMIVQSICLLDQLDKDLNTFSMRVREWYSYHFPELVRIVNDNYQFCQLAALIESRDTLTTSDKSGEIEAIVTDPEVAARVVDAAKKSMGADISPVDMINIKHFAARVRDLTAYRKSLHQYLTDKMNLCAPNLSALIGEQIGARLISHAGSLTNLAKYPASTVQILGAEKALFRALKTRGNTPKYGLIFHSSFIGRAKPKNKGRISRYLANKCSIASRIDCFGEQSSSQYGIKLKAQVEERLEFYKTGKAPRKNIDVMQEAVKAAALDDPSAEGGKEKKKKDKKDKKRKEPEEETVAAEPEKKKKKKDKTKKEE